MALASSIFVSKITNNYRPRSKIDQVSTYSTLPKVESEIMKKPSDMNSMPYCLVLLVVEAI